MGFSPLTLLCGICVNRKAVALFNGHQPVSISKAMGMARVTYIFFFLLSDPINFGAGEYLGSKAQTP
jgi:hypothetical protein